MSADETQAVSISDPFGFYRGLDEPTRPLADRDPPVQQVLESTGTYIPDESLMRAVNVALLLGMPLLLTGDPGVGKTRLASHLAEMHRAPFEKFVVTSTAIARDLLYAFDDLARMRDAYRDRSATYDLRRYLRFNALGTAILRACEPRTPLQEIAVGAAVADQIEGDTSPLWLRLGQSRPRDAPPPMVGDLFDLATDAGRLARREFDQGKPTVVLIDEIDKAPRELPNDLLTEFDRFEFDIPELGLRVTPPGGTPRPVLIVTSNRETALPDPFLRRCCYHHIGFPDDEMLARIVDGHLAALGRGDRFTGFASGRQSGFRAEARAFARELREPGRLVRPPGLAEIIEWHVLVETRLLPALRGVSRFTDPAFRAVLPATLSVMLKTPEDLEAGLALLRERFFEPALA
jgi:MoxR-like ATPase